jgi:hypothetical protein
MIIGMSAENIWHPDADINERVDRLRRERDERCADGRHEDPDYSGCCIHCGAVLYETTDEAP